MGILDLTCRNCDFLAFGVNVKRCPRCGSSECYVTSDEDLSDVPGDPDEDDAEELDADDPPEMEIH